MRNVLERNESKGAGRHSLLIGTLENVSKDAFSKHYAEITEIIGNRHGIYALYDDEEIYYVGKSTELRKRVRQHLRDRHLASWTHFSLYLVRKVEHIHEIESLLVRLASPKGNRIKFKSKASGQLLAHFKRRIKEKLKKEYEGIFVNLKTSRQRKPDKAQNPRILKGLVPEKTQLYRQYKGEDYTATLTPLGEIILRGKKYKTPTAAAKAVVSRTSVNGWRFWYIKNLNGVWITLSEYKSAG